MRYDVMRHLVRHLAGVGFVFISIAMLAFDKSEIPQDSLGFEHVYPSSSLKASVLQGQSNAMTADAVMRSQPKLAVTMAVKKATFTASTTAVAGAAWITVPATVAVLMCFINDNIAKERIHGECAAQGRTVVMENSGMCGLNPRYHCDRNSWPAAQAKRLHRRSGTPNQ